MSKFAFVSITSAVLGLLVLGQAALGPPKIAVVDITSVFDGYEKKDELQRALAERSQIVEAKFKTLEKQLQSLKSTIQLMQAGEKRNVKLLERTKLEIDMKTLQDVEIKALREQQLAALKELREEIAEEIKAYALAYDLDLVLERTVTAEIGPGDGFKWPIVHYAKPQFDITAQVTKRLNEKFRNGR